MEKTTEYNLGVELSFVQERKIGDLKGHMDTFLNMTQNSELHKVDEFIHGYLLEHFKAASDLEINLYIINGLGERLDSIRYTVHHDKVYEFKYWEYTRFKKRYVAMSGAVISETKTLIEIIRSSILKDVVLTFKDLVAYDN